MDSQGVELEIKPYTIKKRFSIKEYLIKHQYSIGTANIGAGLIFLSVGIFLAQFTYWIFNVFMWIGIIGFILGIIICSTAKNANP